MTCTTSNHELFLLFSTPSLFQHFTSVPVQQEWSGSSKSNFHVPEPPFQPHVLKTLLSFSIPVTNSVTALPSTAKHLSSRLSSILPHCSAEGLSWHLLCSFSLFYAQQRDLVDTATHRTYKLPLVPPLRCLLFSIMTKSSLSEVFLLLYRTSPYTILDPIRKYWCSCAMRPCWGTRTTILGPSLFCQQQTISLGHETPPP